LTFLKITDKCRISESWIKDAGLQEVARNRSFWITEASARYRIPAGSYVGEINQGKPKFSPKILLTKSIQLSISPLLKSNFIKNIPWEKK